MARRAQGTMDALQMYESIWGRAREKSLAYDVGQAKAVRGQLDNLRNRRSGLIKSMASMDSEGYGKGGGWAAWKQAMNGVLKTMEKEKSGVRRETNKLRTEILKRNKDNLELRKRPTNWTTTNGTLWHASEAYAKARGTAAGAQAALSAFNSLRGKSPKEETLPFVLSTLYGHIAANSWGDADAQSAALVWVKKFVSNKTDGTINDPAVYLEQELPILSEAQINREVSRQSGSSGPLLRNYHNWLWANQPTSGQQAGLVPPGLSASPKTKQAWLTTEYKLSDDGTTVTRVTGTKVQQIAAATGEADTGKIKPGQTVSYEEAVKAIQGENLSLKGSLGKYKQSIQVQIDDVDRDIIATKARLSRFPGVSAAEFAYRSTPGAPVAMRRGVSEGVGRKLARASIEEIEAQNAALERYQDSFNDAMKSGEPGSIDTAGLLLAHQSDLMKQMYGDDPDGWPEGERGVFKAQNDSLTRAVLAERAAAAAEEPAAEEPAAEEPAADAPAVLEASDMYQDEDTGDYEPDATTEDPMKAFVQWYVNAVKNRDWENAKNLFDTHYEQGIDLSEVPEKLRKEWGEARQLHRRVLAADEENKADRERRRPQALSAATGRVDSDEGVIYSVDDLLKGALSPPPRPDDGAVDPPEPGPDVMGQPSATPPPPAPAPAPADDITFGEATDLIDVEKPAPRKAVPPPPPAPAPLPSRSPKDIQDGLERKLREALNQKLVTQDDVDTAQQYMDDYRTGMGQRDDPTTGIELAGLIRDAQQALNRADAPAPTAPEIAAPEAPPPPTIESEAYQHLYDGNYWKEPEEIKRNLRTLANKASAASGVGKPEQAVKHLQLLKEVRTRFSEYNNTDNNPTIIDTMRSLNSDISNLEVMMSPEEQGDTGGPDDADLQQSMRQ